MTAQPAESSRPITAQDWLALLQAPAREAQPVWSDPSAMVDFCQAIELALTEQSGMADELLCVYEQLGIVFEVTRKLPTVSSEREIIRLFLNNLRVSFRGCIVQYVKKKPGENWRAPDSVSFLGGQFEAGINKSLERGCVVLEVPPATGFCQCMFGPVFVGDAADGAILLVRRHAAREFRASDMCLLQALTAFCGDLIRNIRLLRELKSTSVAMVRSLVNAVDQKDEYTSGHSLRVGYYATMLGRELKLNSHDLQMLQWSALLHDVGKIGIRDDVLKKPGKLTEEEFNHIKEHPLRSYKVVKEVPQMAEALDGVLYHHERYDGSGYPSGLVGETIPKQARIIQIADVFDALTSSRSYRPANDWKTALAIMAAESGKTVDPALREMFDRLIRDIANESHDAWAKLVHRAGEFDPMPDDSEGDWEDPSV